MGRCPNCERSINWVNYVGNQITYGQAELTSDHHLDHELDECGDEDIDSYYCPDCGYEFRSYRDVVAALSIDPDDDNKDNTECRSVIL